MRVRGLKLAVMDHEIVGVTSHPMRVRGLKRVWKGIAGSGYRRTPCGCVD